jgi:predicted metalloprotease
MARQLASCGVWARTVVAVALLVVVTGCVSQKVAGTPKPLGEIDPGTVAGLPVTQGPSGLKRGVADARLPVENGDGGEMDRLAINAISDVNAYWTERFRFDFEGRTFQPARRLISYDSGAQALQVCRTSTAGLVNAFYCPQEDTIAWDRGELLPLLNQGFGPMSVVTVLAHEMGHAVQHRLRLVNQATPTIVSEQQADCFTGAFFRHIAEDRSEHFQISTGDGLNKVLGALFFIRDPAGTDFRKQGAHGSAFDRVSAFQFGFSSGPTVCARIDPDEVKKRITELPFDSDDNTKGQLPVDERGVQLVEQSLRDAFNPNGGQLPKINSGLLSCPGGRRGTQPVRYCPDTNTVSYSVGALQAIGTPPRRGQQGGNGIGDFAAYAELASRYVLSVQKTVGLPLEGETTGLRTACLVGAWAGVLIEHPFGNRNPISGVRLAPGDLDEAVAELLSDKSLIATDVDGKQVRSGFARVEAFRIGFMQGSGPCTEKFS